MRNNGVVFLDAKCDELLKSGEVFGRMQADPFPLRTHTFLASWRTQTFKVAAQLKTGFAAFVVLGHREGAERRECIEPPANQRKGGRGAAGEGDLEQRPGPAAGSFTTGSSLAVGAIGARSPDIDVEVSSTASLSGRRNSFWRVWACAQARSRHPRSSPII